jgi:Flp pilus assembly protein TadD
MPNIVDNENIKDANFKTVLHYWKKPFLKLYIPVTYTVWTIVWNGVSYFVPQDKEYRTHAQVFHRVNLLFHILNSILIFFIISILIGDKFSACIGTLLFAIHPIQVESVAYVSELRTLLACFFSLLSIHQYLIYNVSNNENNSDNYHLLQRGARGDFGGAQRSILHANKRLYFHYSFSLICFIFALLSKPISVIVPFYLFIINHFFLQKDMKKNIVNILPWVVLSAVMMFVTILVQTPDRFPQYITPFWLRPFIAFDATAFYLMKIIYPNSLGIDYARTPELVLNQWWGYLTWVLPIALFVFFLHLRQKYPLYLACLILFFIGFLPVSGVVHFLFQKFSTVADRYLYFSMLGPAIAAAIFLRNEKKLLHLLPMFCIVILLMMTTYAQAKTWNNGITLYNHALKVNPNSYWARNNLANCIVKDDLIGAILLYQEAITINPDYPKALGNIAVTLLKIKNYHPDFRIEQLVNTKKNSKQEESEHLKAGIKAFQKNDARTALKHFGTVTALNILNPKSYNNIGVFFIYVGDYNGAVWLLRTAITLFPENPEALNNLAIAHYYRGELKDSLEYFDKALSMGKLTTEIASNREKALKGMNEGRSVIKTTVQEFEYLLQD